MSESYDKIQVKWITSAQKIAEYRNRGIEPSPDCQNAERTCGHGLED